MKIGAAFSDHVKTEKTPSRHYGRQSPQSMRGYLLLVVLGGALSLLIFKLSSLQLVYGQYYRSLSDSNRIRTSVIHAPRGVIFDRNGVPLVYNVPGFREIGKNNKTTLMSREQALPLLAKGAKNIEVDSLRDYPFKDALSHVLGYTGQISREEMSRPSYMGYQITDYVGKEGIEKQYEQMLRGTDGRKLVEVDATGKTMRVLGETDPLPGNDLTLTIDVKLQEQVYNAMKGVKKGAAIVSTPNGQILAMVSKPSFDPNLFTMGPTYKAASGSAYTRVSQILLDGQNQPLLNRAIGGVYPPGSTFKLVNAAAGLEDHVIDKNFSITDTGILKIGNFSFANWYYTDYGRTEQGPVNVVRAIARSNDIFFYKLAEKVQVDRLSAMARKFGLGSVLGIDLPGEEAGTVPTEEWKKKTIGESWYLGDTYHYGIGQGFLLTTPLQVNSWTGTIASGGTLYKPHILRSMKPEALRQDFLSQNTVDLIRQGMVEGCSTGGVAWPLFNFKVQNAKLKIDGKDFLPVASSSADTRQIILACKTGTAQHGGDKTLPHAWITLFAPAYHPQIVVTILSESSGEGSNIAGPIAKDILTKYFEGEK